MAFPTRSLGSHYRAPSGPSSSTAPSPALAARIEEKRVELQNLKELKDLSAAVAGQMEALEQRIATLSDGTEAIAAVVGNWHNVLQAINMASSKLANPLGDGAAVDGAPSVDGPPLPQTLVRIPTEHAPALQAQTEAVEAAAAEEDEAESS